MRALGRVLWQNARYLGFSLVPLAWVALPLTLVIAQLQAFYGYDGLALGRPALLTLRWSPGTAVPAADAIGLEAPGGVPAQRELEEAAVDGMTRDFESHGGSGDRVAEAEQAVRDPDRERVQEQEAQLPQRRVAVLGADGPVEELAHGLRGAPAQEIQEALAELRRGLAGAPE